MLSLNLRISIKIYSCNEGGAMEKRADADLVSEKAKAYFNQGFN